ncbi:ribonuclease E activity regulator RraA [Ralstonia nicotianae]|uniref:ribonuclease E activity regulator RraA n=1 Tax=Ralstonia pseudosolanacearum TaxID=1310165 RepID=UPI0002C05442|nr:MULTISPECIES: ribonuclease E activity regulator RraA [Ralstonia]ANH33298.1 Ribonuclease E inhibitor RraA [Ralstonia solanacearum]AGH83913.1 Ribonuclease E inhibitor RraA [Ralstonia pseudosolanacearum FQY_4]AUS44979.1 ribonuclease [Ralstonia solanacearum]AXV69313.1 ribonuclease [Ralstonia solanacearum]AXV95950.1 ribonuclease [Ralstonia solanacearum]
MTTMMIPVTDLCDAHEDQLASGAVRVLAPVFHSFGARAAFAGPAATLKVFEDNGLVRAMLEQPGEGRVLVVDGGGSLRCALVGGNLAKLAEDNGWEGVLVNGCVRDTRELAACNVGVHALVAHPRKSFKKNQGERDIGVQMPGAYIHPGEWIYGDEDGVLVSRERLHD